MTARKNLKVERTRELRRRVVVPARLRHGPTWSDACILNISSRGMMIHSGRQITQGTRVEVRRGDHVIVAHVVWRDGARAGLQAEDRVPVEAIMTLGQSPSFQLTARSERRRKLRPEGRSRLQGRAIEFAGAAFIAVSLALAGLMLVETAFARPMGLVLAALSN
ncbi:MAG TPA: PilZ domain-containing protein [Sphingomicrobium sp.]|jgi:hypothetical protein|nr:PilZ domain-containing protein [Sphingomicrobium sp.]